MSYGIIELAQSKTLIAILALVTHHALHRSEWDNAFHIVIGSWAIAFGSIAAFEHVADTRANSLGIAIQHATQTALFYLAVLIVSILLHRGIFHRLRKASLNHTLAESPY
jgi:Na+/H+ antiporter NhaD/arsenite permease-like protein